MSELKLASVAIGWLARRAKELGTGLAEKLTAEAETRLFNWLKSRLSAGGEDDVLSAVEAAPGDDIAAKQAEVELGKLLRDEPALIPELQALLSSASPASVTQSIGSAGDDAIQIVGSNNKVG